MQNTTVIVGMSGGVDSSVSALLLKQQGYKVIGLFMKNWEETDSYGVCKSAKEYEDVVSVCNQLEIPYYSVNFVEEYRKEVFADFVRNYQAGLTPNPDILCNREIKFKAFLNKAIELGADYLATGHYCQTHKGKLFKGLDPDKDQSYFLHAISGKALQKVVFPVGHLTKKEVRELAKKNKLSTSEKKDSTGICFIGKRDFKPFLAQYVHTEPGHFETLNGQIVGKHDGLPFYTLGQRKGIGLGGEGEAWYVIGKDLQRNVILVERGAEHPALYADELIAHLDTWIADKPDHFPYPCSAKIRYRQLDQSCVIESMQDGLLHVRFDTPQRAATPGQSIVFYQNNECLGGAIIQTIGPSYFEQNKQLDIQIYNPA
ncbi:MAG: tRNA 2-thiouridine(34) synthase MnmA [Chlamydiales bacterium]|nr:tRNA 2-thiouridine(34) synthase MnmA [Chlamydiales bacterium]